MPLCNKSGESWNKCTEEYSIYPELTRPVFPVMPQKNSHSGPGRPKDPAKREAILSAAKSLFLQRGFEGCSMDAIATDAGVSKLTVYSHFSDKETLFSEVVKSKCKEELPELLFDLSGETPINETLCDIGRAFFDLVMSPETIEMHRVMIAGANKDPRLSRLFFEAGPQRVLREMEHLLLSAQERGLLSLPDLPLAAEQFFTLIKGSHHFRTLLGCCEPMDEEETDRHVRQSVELFLKAYQRA